MSLMKNMQRYASSICCDPATCRGAASMLLLLHCVHNSIRFPCFGICVLPRTLITVALYQNKLLFGRKIETFIRILLVLRGSTVEFPLFRHVAASGAHETIFHSLKRRLPWLQIRLRQH